MYYGGGQKRPDAPYVRPVINPDGKVVGHVGEGNRKDVRNAVETAHAAAPGYVGKTSKIPVMKIFEDFYKCLYMFYKHLTMHAV